MTYGTYHGRIAPWLGHFLFNAYYPTEEEYVYAMAEMFKGEYEAVVDAGFILQIDDPGLADKFGLFYPPITVEAFRQHAELRIEATNWALSNIPKERVRYHTCWGSWHTPHTTDIPFTRTVGMATGCIRTLRGPRCKPWRKVQPWPPSNSGPAPPNGATARFLPLTA